MRSTYIECFFFFFQAEDGILDKLVTGVQTCALPIRAVARVPPVPRAAGAHGRHDDREQRARQRHDSDDRAGRAARPGDGVLRVRLRGAGAARRLPGGRPRRADRDAPRGGAGRGVDRARRRARGVARAGVAAHAVGVAALAPCTPRPASTPRRASRTKSTRSGPRTRNGSGPKPAKPSTGTSIGIACSTARAPRFTAGFRAAWSTLATTRSIGTSRSEEHTSELQSLAYLVCRLLLEKKKKKTRTITAPRMWR